MVGLILNSTKGEENAGVASMTDERLVARKRCVANQRRELGAHRGRRPPRDDATAAPAKAVWPRAGGQLLAGVGRGTDDRGAVQSDVPLVPQATKQVAGCQSIRSRQCTHHDMWRRCRADSGSMYSK